VVPDSHALQGAARYSKFSGFLVRAARRLSQGEGRTAHAPCRRIRLRAMRYNHGRTGAIATSRCLAVMTRHELEHYLHEHIPLSSAMQVRVVEAAGGWTCCTRT
jgi:hypothetical protein